MKPSTDLSKKPFGINSCFSKGKRGGGETPPGHLRPRGADTRFSRRPCPACRPGETHGVRVRSPGGSEEARPRPERPHTFPRRTARRTCKSRALGGRGPAALGSSSTASPPPPSAIFHRSRHRRRRASRDFRGRLPGNGGGGGPSAPPPPTPLFPLRAPLSGACPPVGSRSFP